jgi:peptide/nickel transport system substrate-binding protein
MTSVDPKLAASEQYAIGRRGFLRLGVGTTGALIGGASLLSFLASCGSAASGNKTLTWARGDDLRTQDPQEIAGLMEGTIARLLYDPLIDTDEGGNKVAALATEWQMAPDGKSYTFKLRSGVKFHDGTPFTGDAVKFTFDRLLANPTLQHAAVWKDSLAQVVVSDPMTVVFNLKAPNPGLINSFGEPILAQNAVEKYGEKFYEKGIGTGPFKYVEWKKNQQWVGDANKDYWNKGVVKLTKITFRPITEEATKIAALKAGELDIIDSLSGDQAEDLAKDSNIVISRVPSFDTIHLTYNFRRAPFNNLDARKAVAYAINKEQITKNILRAGQLVGAPIPPGVVGYDEALAKAVIPYDPEKAKALLQSAGVAPGTKIEFRLNPAFFAKMTEVSQFVSDQLRAVGFNVDMQYLEPGAYTEARKAGKFDLCVQQGNKSPDPDANYTVLVVGQTFGLFYKESRPEIEGLIVAARGELDNQKRDTLYKQVQKLMYDDMAELILYRQEYIWGSRKRVSGFKARADYQTRVFGCDVTG